MKFYELRDNSSFERNWTTSVSIHPRSHIVKWWCPDCGRSDDYPTGSFDVTIEGGTAYPDILGCGAYPFLIVSERVLRSWQHHRIGQLIAYSVGVATALDTKLQPHDAPNYFRVEVGGECMIDFAASGIRITSVCRRCGEINRGPLTTQSLILLEGSWDGSALVRDHRYFPRVIFCTQQVCDLTIREKHTNFRFEETRSQLPEGDEDISTQ